MEHKLILLPQDQENKNHSYHVIPLSYDKALWGVISACEGKHGTPLTQPIASYCGSVSLYSRTCFGHGFTTPLGNIINQLPVWRLKKLFKDFPPEWRRDQPWANKAALAFLEQMPDKQLVWLYWH